MVHTGQTAHWIRRLNEDFILILPSSSPITNKPGCSHMLSYSLMHVTSRVCGILNAHVCVCVCSADNGQTMFVRCFVGVQSCEGAVFTLEERCQSSGTRSPCCSIINCCISTGIHLRCATHYCTCAQQQTVIGCSQSASLSPLY